MLSNISFYSINELLLCDDFHIDYMPLTYVTSINKPELQTTRQKIAANFQSGIQSYPYTDITST